MTKNFDELIEQKQTEIDNLKEQMETIRLKFVDETATVMSQWFQPKAKYILESDSDRSLKLKDNQFEQIKAKVKVLTENAQGITETFLSEPKVWWHMSQEEESYYSFHGNRAPIRVDRAIRLGLGLLAPILEEFGYLKNQHGRGDLDSWREWDSSGNRKITNSPPYYPQGFDWSQEMKDTIKLYDEKVAEAKKIAREIVSLESEKKRTQISDRWDST